MPFLLAPNSSGVNIQAVACVEEAKFMPVNPRPKKIVMHGKQGCLSRRERENLLLNGCVFLYLITTAVKVQSQVTLLAKVTRGFWYCPTMIVSYTNSEVMTYQSSQVTQVAISLSHMRHFVDILFVS
jgi:hypothetical protein